MRKIDYEVFFDKISLSNHCGWGRGGWAKGYRAVTDSSHVLKGVHFLQVLKGPSISRVLWTIRDVRSLGERGSGLRTDPDSRGGLTKCGQSVNKKIVEYH
jgi:hypothetical protein